MKELFVISLLLCIYSIFAFTAPQRVLVRPYPVPNVHYGFDTSHSTTTPWKSSIWMTDDEIETEKVTVWKKVKNYIRGSNDGLTTKQRLAKLGLNAVLSYGWVSNMSYCVSVSLAWYIFSKRTGLSPLAPGQWKKFLAVYAGFWMFNNIVRPMRVGVAVAISPQFEKIVENIRNRFQVSKTVAVTMTVLLANLVGTTLFMSLGIALAALLAGVPVFPPKI